MIIPDVKYLTGISFVIRLEKTTKRFTHAQSMCTVHAIHHNNEDAQKIIFGEEKSAPFLTKPEMATSNCRV